MKNSLKSLNRSWVSTFEGPPALTTEDPRGLLRAAELERERRANRRAATVKAQTLSGQVECAYIDIKGDPGEEYGCELVLSEKPTSEVGRVFRWESRRRIRPKGEKPIPSHAGVCVVLRFGSGEAGEIGNRFLEAWGSLRWLHELERQANTEKGSWYPTQMCAGILSRTWTIFKFPSRSSTAVHLITSEAAPQHLDGFREFDVFGSVQFQAHRSRVTMVRG